MQRTPIHVSNALGEGLLEVLEVESKSENER